MQLSIQNVGKIKACSVDIDGLTVITGKNNTGKSTISRALFSIVESFRDIDRKIIWDRKITIRYILQEATRRPVRDIDDKLFEIVRDDIESSARKQKIQRHLSENYEFVKEMDHDEFQAMVEKFLDLSDIPSQDIIEAILDKTFNDEFNEQINHINCRNESAKIILRDGRYSCSVTFINNECVEFTNEKPSLAKALYIDSPSAIDSIGRNYYRVSASRYSPRDRELLVRALSRKMNPESFITEVLNNRKLESIMDRINHVTGGEYYDNDSRTSWRDEELDAPLELSNLSSGLKMFAIIKRLIENGALQPGDFLIMDEPEIHLHPQWQIIFAEILTLLHKEFGLRLLINTHSPYFLNAIEVYSSRNQIEQSLKIYKAETDGAYASISDVTGSVQEVYEQMAMPFQYLEDQKYE